LPGSRDESLIGGNLVRKLPVDNLLERNYAVHLPKTRIVEDYLLLPKEALASFQEGGLSPNQGSFSVAFWLSYTGKCIPIKKIGSEVGKIFSLGFGAFVVGFRAPDANRGITPDLWADPFYSTFGSIMLLPNVWYHLAISLNREEDSLAFFVDGRKSNLILTLANSSFPSTIQPTTPIMLGCGGSNKTQYGSVGFWMDDLRIYERSLSGQEFARLYSGEDRNVDSRRVPSLAQANSLRVGLRAQWTFDQKGGDLYDLKKENYLQDVVGGYAFKPNIQNSSVTQTLGNQVYFRYDPDTKDFYPKDENEEILFAYLKKLTSDKANFEILEDALDFSLEKREIWYKQFGLWKTAYMLGSLHGGSNLLGILKDFMLLPPELFTWESVFKEGSIHLPVRPDIVTIGAYFGTWQDKANPVISYQDELLNRVLVVSLLDLLFISNSVSLSSFYLFKTLGFNLNYSAFVLTRMCNSSLPDPVKMAWLRTLEKMGYVLHAPSSETNYLSIGDMETDMDLAAVCFVTRLLGLLNKFGVRDIQQVVNIREKWTKLLVDLKSRANFGVAGGTKGFASSGVGLMDGTINSSYMGLMMDHLVELFNLAEEIEDPVYQKRVGATIQKLASLRAQVQGLHWSKRFQRNNYVAGNSYDNRTNTLHSFTYWQEHGSTAAVPYLSVPEFELNSWPFLKRRFEQLYPDYEKFKSRLTRAIEGTLASPGYMFISKGEIGQKRSEGNQWHKWIHFNPLSVFLHYNDHLETLIQKSEELNPNSEEWEPPATLGLRSEHVFGDPGEEDFFVFHRPKYSAVFCTFTNPTNSIYRGYRGAGLTSLSLQVKRGVWYASIISRFINNTHRSKNPTIQKGADGVCTLPGWKEIPNNHLVGRTDKGEIVTSAFSELRDVSFNLESKIFLSLSCPLTFWNDQDRITGLNLDKKPRERRVYDLSQDESIAVEIWLDRPPSGPIIPEVVYECIPLLSVQDELHIVFVDGKEDPEISNINRGVSKVRLTYAEGSVEITFEFPVTIDKSPLRLAWAPRDGVEIQNLLVELDKHDTHFLLKYKITPLEEGS